MGQARHTTESCPEDRYDAAVLGNSAAAELACVHAFAHEELSPFQVRAARSADAALAGNVDVFCTDQLEHAVVLGASMAGLLAARVLSEFYQQVTVVDRDPMPALGEHRRGVPQGRHLHALHPRGAMVLDDLFPGLLTRLTENGAVGGDVTGTARWQLSGRRFRKEDSGLVGVLGSRPFLEGHVRDAVSAVPNVTLVLGHDICGLVACEDGRRVTGVLIAAHAGAGQVESLSADLVVDATGRGSRTPRWLQELGFEAPPEQRVEIGLGYVSRVYRLQPGALGTDKVIVTGATAERPRGGVLAAMEGDRHIVSLSGILGDHPPTAPAAFEAFAADLIFPDIAEALRCAEPLTDPVPIRFPASVRRRYEQLHRFPQQLLVIGDAVCSFNPVYGQGMTVAALEAMALHRMLTRGGTPDPRRYFRTIARLVDVPWNVAVGGDLAFPQVPGRRTAKIRLVNAYLAQLHAAAESDATLATAFVRVVGMLDRPETLLRPDRILRVLRTRILRVLRTRRKQSAAIPDRPVVGTPG
jgi:2-polyprenyl-6-methoxyphenol hydroxylase-like FAD-dependent oxidoreductase